MIKQEAVIKYITENYLEYNRLRHDVISDKLQLRMEKPTPDPFLKDGGIARRISPFLQGEDLGEAVVWREMTKQDINSIVCHAAQEYDTNITSREVITALQSDLIPNVHPPTQVESIQNPFYTILPYERMYAQAWALAQDPLFSYWFDLDEIEVLEEHNQHFRDESNEEQLLPILFDVPAEGRGEFMTTAQISERLVTYGNIKKPMALGRLGVLMGSMGYRSVTRGNRQARLRGWIVYQRDTEEIAANKKLLAKECVTV